MIEAVELSTPTQRLLHARYQEIHRRFFPRPPSYAEGLELEAHRVADPPPPPKPVELPPPPAIVVRSDHTKLRLRIIQRTVCEVMNVTKQALLSQRRHAPICDARHVFSYLAHKLTRASLPSIGKALGGQDHTTILHGIRRIQMRMDNNHDMAMTVWKLEMRCRNQFGEDRRPRDCIARYVVHERVADHLLLGWMWAANLNEYAALLIWPCACACVEPKE